MDDVERAVISRIVFLLPITDWRVSRRLTRAASCSVMPSSASRPLAPLDRASDFASRARAARSEAQRPHRRMGGTLDSVPPPPGARPRHRAKLGGRAPASALRDGERWSGHWRSRRTSRARARRGRGVEAPAPRAPAAPGIKTSSTLPSWVRVQGHPRARTHNVCMALLGALLLVDAPSTPPAWRARAEEDLSRRLTAMSLAQLNIQVAHPWPRATSCVHAPGRRPRGQGCCRASGDAKQSRTCSWWPRPTFAYGTAMRSPRSTRCTRRRSRSSCACWRRRPT